MKPKKETFLLVSMKEDKAKKLAQVISSDTCRRILDLLAQKEATETQIGDELQMPLSTVHYNLQQLLAANLVTAEEFHYSQKGKEVNHYALANKFIIIAPESKEGLKVSIRHTLPALGVLLLGAGILYFYRVLPREKTMMAAAPEALRSAADESATFVAQNAAGEVAKASVSLGSWFWFLVGGIAVSAVLLLTYFIAKRKG
ncbi:MAG: winged helix-turn-helix domain-containing protein [Nanoarchaeota archaeon]